MTVGKESDPSWQKQNLMLFEIKMLFSGIGCVFRQAIRETFFIPRPSKLHTADELMEVVFDLTSEHGGSGTAFPYAKRALELDPNHIAANRFMAYYYMTSGKFPQALPYAERMILCNPESVSARNILEQVQSGLEQHHI